MARYDVYADPGGSGFLLDVQTDLLSGLNVRCVVPLIPIPDAPKPAKRLNPTFTLKGAILSMATQYISSVPETTLQTPVANFGDRHSEIGGALDMLFLGF